MKKLRILLMMMAAVLVSGCASHSGLVLNTVGPSPSEYTGDNAKGTLLVYSAYLTSADFTMRDPDRQEYSDYRILSADGALVQRVHNNNGTHFQAPMPIALEPGKYEVVAHANGYGDVTVPVVVEAQQVTILHLEGGAPWHPRPAFDTNNSVSLPDGRVIGWKAAANM